MEHPHPGCQRFEHGSIVAHQQDCSLVLLQRVFQRFHRFNVEMIGGLVQQKEVRSTQYHHRQRNTSLLATRERFRATLGFVTREPELREMTLDLAALPSRS